MQPHAADPGIFVETLAALFAEHGQTYYDSARQEPVSALEHALQCAQRAEQAGASSSLVIAALLHDVGHFLAPSSVLANDQVDDSHEARGALLLLPWLGRAVSEPVRLHVAAKRYLISIDAEYGDTLTPASLHSLTLQGGEMSEAECAHFEALPYAAEATMLRRWDDAAKEPGKPTPPLSYYLAML
jgi:phosphonate degradation associated HDIG domain protein